MNKPNALDELIKMSRANEYKEYDDMEFTVIDIERVLPNSLNTAPMTDIDDLTTNIKVNGLKTPLIAYKENDNYILLSGHRRRLALINNDIKEVPIIEVSKPIDDVEEKKAIVLLNAQREETDEDINNKILEIAELYDFEKEQDPSKVLGKKNDYISSYIGLSPRTVARRLKELGMTKEIKPKEVTGKDSGKDDELEHNKFIESTIKNACKNLHKLRILDINGHYIRKEDFDFNDWEKIKENLMLIEKSAQELMKNMEKQTE